MIVTDIWKALAAGKEIKNPATWKNAQTTANALASLLATVVTLAKLFGYNIPVTDEQVIVISGAIAALLGVVNGIVTTISSSKVGFKEVPK